MAVDNGLLYVADLGNHRIQVFELEGGTYKRQWGSNGNADGQFNGPWGIAVCGGYIAVSEYRGNRIQVFSKDGSFISKWGSNGNQDGHFSYPAGIAYTNLSLYVCDYDNKRIQVFK